MFGAKNMTTIINPGIRSHVEPESANPTQLIAKFLDVLREQDSTTRASGSSPATIRPEPLAPLSDLPLPFGVPARPNARWLAPVQELGRGSFGVVMLTRDKKNRMHVAEKFIAPPKSPNDRDCFVRETQREMSAALWEHKNLVKILWASWPTVDNPNVIIGMEYLAGGTLTERMERKQGPWSLSATVHIIGQVLSALDYLQRKHGIVHRDVKPENILFASHALQSLKLGDFGTVVPIEHPDTKESIGTPGYIAPEVFNDSHSIEKCDVWGTGVILHQLATDDLSIVRFGRSKRPPLPVNLLLLQKFSRGIDPTLLPFPDDKIALQVIAEKMLRSDPIKRWSISRAHKAFQDLSKQESPLRVLPALVQAKQIQRPMGFEGNRHGVIPGIGAQK